MNASVSKRVTKHHTKVSAGVEGTIVSTIGLMLTLVSDLMKTVTVFFSFQTPHVSPSLPHNLSQFPSHSPPACSYSIQTTYTRTLIDPFFHYSPDA